MLAKQIYVGSIVILFGLGSAAKVVDFRRKLKIDPIALRRAGSRVERYLGGLFAVLVVFYLAAGTLCTIAPSSCWWLYRFASLDRWPVNLVGFILSLASLTLMSSAQSTMGNSWRIGIDSDHKTELVTAGVFRYSRNPIYLGMIVLAVGVFLILPSVATLIGAIVAYVAISAQIRLEEDHMERAYGDAYRKYIIGVGRFFPRILSRKG